MQHNRAACLCPTQYLENAPQAFAHVHAALQWRERKYGAEHLLSVNAAANLAYVGVLHVQGRVQVYSW